jgi:hypothetical protein
MASRVGSYTTYTDASGDNQILLLLLLLRVYSTDVDGSRTLQNALESCRTLQKPQGTKGTRGTTQLEAPRNKGNKGNESTRTLREQGERLDENPQGVRGTTGREFTVNKGNKSNYSARSLREQGELLKKNPQGTKGTRGATPRKSSVNKEQGGTNYSRGAEGSKGNSTKILREQETRGNYSRGA